MAASGETKEPTVEYGLFVSAQNNGGYVGYSGGNNNGGGGPVTPEAYFASSPRPSSDLNWDDASKSHSAGAYVNGEGSFTPVTNGATGAGGSYASTSGFWFSVPTTAANTGTAYIPGSTAELAAGATFATQVEFTIPAGPNASWPGNNVKMAGQTWNKAVNGRQNQQMASSPYLQYGACAGKWTASKPTNTKNPDGSYTFKGTITFTTSQPMKLTQSGTKYYGQVLIMPATIQMIPAYGWNDFSLTSSVTGAQITYSGQNVPGGSATTAVPAMTTTSTITP